MAIGGVKNRGNLILSDKVELSLPKNAVDCFTTWVDYDESAIKYYKENNRIGGYKGVVCPKIFPIDIDCGGDLELSLTVCKEITGMLVHVLDVDRSSFKIFYSGSKGYHIEIPGTLFEITPAPQKEICRRFKSIALKLHDNIDDKIYKPNMLWRCANTINSKSGLYKVQIHYNELHSLSTSEVLELAKSTRFLEYVDCIEWVSDDTLGALWAQTLVEVQKPRPDRQNTAIFTSDNPLEVPNGAIKGNRNEKCFEIALNCRSHGYGIEDAKEFILKWNRGNIPPVKNHYELTRTIESAYSYEVGINSIVGLKAHFRDDGLYNSLDNNGKVMYTHVFARLNDADKEFAGIMILQDQWVYSNRTFAEAVNVGVQKVKDFIKRMVEAGRIQVDVVTVQSTGFNKRQLLTWLY